MCYNFRHFYIHHLTSADQTPHVRKNVHDVQLYRRKKDTNGAADVQVQTSSHLYFQIFPVFTEK